ncbi:MAG TPA: hypothetical protein VG271_09725 [Beijerinckiaceae bacterium]|jgi:hypothetical protein|nr:hypothetical protein [Beijerinckiaceae bacterium]
MIRVRHLIALTSAMMSIGSADAQSVVSRSCNFSIKARCVSGDAHLTLADGTVTSIEINVDWCGLRGQPAYSCSISSSRGDKDSLWSDEQGATLISNASPFSAQQPDRVKVTVGRFVSIDMQETQSLGRCGAGAELPEAIVMPERGNACRIWLSDP